ncbi:MAG: glycosyltransferase family 39 protein [Clostridia bacterium]|nr:glycosyltransferase family 39 protein [Clostridia bacterium]
MEAEAKPKLKKMHNDRTDKYVLYVFTAGIIIRIFFALKVIFCVTAHDSGFIDYSPLKIYDIGHLGYINFLSKYKTLPTIELFYPDSIVCQYYHPPVFYVISAIVKSLINNIGLSDVIAYECIQQMNSLFSCLSLLVSKKMIDEIGLTSYPRLIAVALCSFNPIFIILGVIVNNDCLMTLFCLLALLYTAKWIKNSSWKNTMLIMSFLVLGILTKTSAILIAPAIGSIFIYGFITKKHERVALLKKFFVFGITSVPLGLSWIIRNNIKFNLPLNYIPQTAELQIPENLNTFSRMLLPSLKQITTFSVPKEEYLNYTNIWGQMFQTMLFDEGILYNPNKILALVLLWSGIILYLTLFVLFVLYLFSKAPIADKLLLGIAHFGILAMFISFAYQYPCICTVHYRYIAVIFVVMVIGAAKYISSNLKLTKVIGIMTTIFSVSSLLCYLLY